MIKYEFDLEFELPVSYPVTPFEIVLPELDGKTSKMYRGGKICLSSHFKPLWAKNVPQFGIAHALAMGVSALCKCHSAERCRAVPCSAALESSHHRPTGKRG